MTAVGPAALILPVQPGVNYSALLMPGFHITTLTGLPHGYMIEVVSLILPIMIHIYYDVHNFNISLAGK